MVAVNRIYCGDCLKVMPHITDKSIDMVLCDLPYGVTYNKWDAVIPFDPLWGQYRRIIADHGVIVLTASQPFTSMLIMSNPRMFKHEWVWIKNRGSNFANTVREPMREHESVLVFANRRWTYNKQMQERMESSSSAPYEPAHKTKSGHYSKFAGIGRTPRSKLRVPSSWQKFSVETRRLHPTVKPVPLFEYLIKTYTNEGDTVLDNCAGSGTTGVACQNLKRDFILIEKEFKYCEIAKRRVWA